MHHLATLVSTSFAALPLKLLKLFSPLNKFMAETFFRSTPFLKENPSEMFIKLNKLPNDSRRQAPGAKRW
jgi:hypothetical protein